MEWEQLYQAIFHRKSVRKYDPSPMPAESISALEAYCKTISPLVPSLKTEWKIFSGNDVKSSAPHALCLFSEKSNEARMNAGFLMEQVDLYLSANHIGACWLGTAKPDKAKDTTPTGLEWIATLCFGTPAQPMHREGAAQFKRKTLNEISDISDLYHVLEAVRLAPSSMNSQPWYFSGNTQTVVVSRKKSLLLGKLNQIDIGIALCCLWLSLKHQGKEASFEFSPVTVSKGYEFMASVSITSPSVSYKEK
ncbi:MAG: nitroreductase family protein [Christensenella sp.]|nr:nitroreductase family protein [Christensenella sp.]